MKAIVLSVRSLLPSLLSVAALLPTATINAQQNSAPQMMGIDRDNNGLSDLYQSLHPGVGPANADDDGDGQSNRQENAAGTNPRSPVDRLDFAEVGMEIGGIQTEWSGQSGKLYQIQTAPSPAGPWVNEGAPMIGNGSFLNCTCPRNGTIQFMRLVVADVDSDADGVTDWEEGKAGTDPLLSDTDGDGRTDMERITAQLDLPNRINLAATQARGNESTGLPLIFQFIRSGNLNPLTVNYTVSGTATAGTDFTAPSGVVIFPMGATTATVTLTPLADGLAEGAESIVLQVEAGNGYTVGNQAQATGQITERSEGLLGQYFNGQESTYPVFPATNTNFNPGLLTLTRAEGPIDFNWGAGPPAGTSLTNADSWSIRWQGQILPPATGDYTFHLMADRGAVLTIGTTNVISQWSAAAGTEYNSAAIALTAGVPVNVRLDYRESGTTATASSVRLSWTPPGGVKAVVPTGVLSCETTQPGAPPVLSGPPFAFALRNAPFSHQITGNPAATSYAADGLPAGLSIDPVSGLISGITTAPAGLAAAVITGSNAAGTAILQVPILVLDSGGGYTRDVWTGLSGTGLQSVPFASPPSTTEPLTTLAAPANAGDQFGDRLRGYITAPVSGNYTFFLTGDETAEFWLSSSEEPGRRLKRSWVTDSGLAPATWNALTSQKSLMVRLSAGQRYYFEALRRETTGPDHLAIGWLRPGQSGTAPSEVVPGWALSPYVPAAAVTPEGTLYIANLTPQNGAITLGTGSAILRVNAAKTAARLTFTYSNLTGPIISQHLHDSHPEPGPVGAVIFDIDDEDPDAQGFRHWTFTATGNHTLADIIAAVESGACYLNLHTSTYPNGEVRGFFQPAIGSQFFVPPANPPAAELALPANATQRKQDIVRFLQQATFGGRQDSDGAPNAGASNSDPFGGYDPDSIESVDARGYAQWLEDQLALPAGDDPETLVLQPLLPGTVYAGVSNSRRRPNANTTFYNGSGPLASFIRQHYERYPRTGVDPDGAVTESASDLYRAWWRASCTAPDQVRHRMAYALSQILVASEDGPLDERVRAVAQYYDVLYFYGLDNFRTLLEKITLNPAMGRYLDMLGNRKPNLATGYIPNENYAREILQLFSIGLKRLHPDGTAVLDANGLPIPTYGQDNVVGYAHTFTGWNYGPGGSANFISPMVPSASNHDTGEKLLLENAVLPANATPTVTTCNDELKASHDVIFHHPNVGPFITRQLIQRLVTANPSPGYIYRTAQAFEDNGSGIRGDLKAVVRAILLDPEARNAAPRLQPGYGKLKEPVLRATQMIRAFKGYSHAEATWANAIDLGVAIMSPSGNINLAQPLRTVDVAYTSGTVETVTSSYIDDVIDADGTGTAFSPVTYSFVVAPGNFILLRRQTAPPAGGLVTDANGDTNSPENGLYVFTGNGIPLTRAPQADTAAELNQAWISLTSARRDTPGTPGGSNLPSTNGGSFSGNRYYQQTATITNLGTDPVKWNLNSTGNNLRRRWDMGDTRSSFQQTPLRSPTVFNFYEPDYVFLGATGNAGLYGPEFQITSETSAITTANWFYELTRRNSSSTSSPLSYGQGYSYGAPIQREIKLDLTTERALAATSFTLVDHLSTQLMPGQMTPRLRTLLTDHLNTIAATSDADKMNRLGEALYLISLSPEFATQR